MADQRSICTWEVFGASVRGAAHLRSGLPNQDALAWHAAGGDMDGFRIVAVADGHGSTKSVRSDCGAQFAVKIAVELLHELQQGQSDPKQLNRIERAAEVDLPRRIEQRWREAVETHLRDNPLTLDVEKLAAKDRDIVHGDPHIAYGATLLAALLTDYFALYLQLGDGDILVVTDEGAVRRPVPVDDRNFANETLSLCSRGAAGGRHRPSSGDGAASSGAGAWSEFRQRVQPLEKDNTPALVLLSTDGYANSFRSDADFLKVGSDLLEVLKSEGVDPVKNRLADWLNEASGKGSGDDVTLGLVYRRPIRASISPTDAPTDTTVTAKHATDAQTVTAVPAAQPVGPDVSEAAAKTDAQPPVAQGEGSWLRRFIPFGRRH